MKHLLRTGAFAAVLCGLAACVTPPGQSSPTTSAADVDRNLSGVWQVVNTANYNLEAHPAQAAMQMRDGPVKPVPAKSVVALGAVGAVPGGESFLAGGGDIPYTPAARAKRDENKANWIDRDPEVKCYLPGVPRATYIGMPFHILQSDRKMTIVYQYANAIRHVALEDPGDALIDSWMGQSYGYWDDDTFVIEVTALNGKAWLDRAGNHYSPSATVTERYTKITPYHIRYTATIEDPATYTEPWTISMILHKKLEEEAALYDFNCVAFVEELLYGHLRKDPLD